MKKINQLYMQKNKKGKEKMSLLSIVSLIVSIAAIITSIVSATMQSYYADKEYRYKLPPEVQNIGSMNLYVQERENTHIITSDFMNYRLGVVQRNNLQEAYLINSDNEVEKLEIDDTDNTLDISKTNEEKLSKPDIVVDEISYKYMFILLRALDGSYSLSLLYIKSNNEGAAFHQATGIEILELEKSHHNDKEYIGEKQMAAKYIEVLSSCEKYMR